MPAINFWARALIVISVGREIRREELPEAPALFGFWETKMLDGLMSRCTRPTSWACCRPTADCRMYSQACRMPIGPLVRTIFSKVCPSTYSIAM